MMARRCGFQHPVISHLQALAPMVTVTATPARPVAWILCYRVREHDTAMWICTILQAWLLSCCRFIIGQPVPDYSSACPGKTCTIEFNQLPSPPAKAYASHVIFSTTAIHQLMAAASIPFPKRVQQGGHRRSLSSSARQLGRLQLHAVLEIALRFITGRYVGWRIAVVLEAQVMLLQYLCNWS